MTMAYALLLGIPAFLLVYIAFKMEDRHAVMRMFLVSWSWFFMMPMPVVGLELAKEAGYSGIVKVMEIMLIPTVFGFLIWVLYMVLLYMRDSAKAVSGETEFDNEFGD